MLGLESTENREQEKRRFLCTQDGKDGKPEEQIKLVLVEGCSNKICFKFMTRNSESEKQY